MAKHLLDPYDLAQYGLSRSTLAKLRMRGEGPPFIKIGRRVRYRRDDVEAWVAAHRVQSNAEARVRGLV